MKVETFNKLLTIRLRAISETLGTKRTEYAGADDVLANFKNASKLAKEMDASPVTPEVVLWGYLRKHLASVLDFVEGRKVPTAALVHEKIGDSIVYLILLEALLLESGVDAVLSGGGGAGGGGAGEAGGCGPGGCRA